MERPRIRIKMLEFIASTFPFLSERKIWPFYVVVVQGSVQIVIKFDNHVTSQHGGHLKSREFSVFRYKGSRHLYNKKIKQLFVYANQWKAYTHCLHVPFLFH